MSRSTSVRPSDDMIVLAMLLRGSDWVYADEVRGVLNKLGWAVTAQQVGSWLRRLAGEEMPMVEGHDEYGPCHCWTVTPCGRTQIHNRYAGRWAK